MRKIKFLTILLITCLFFEAGFCFALDPLSSEQWYLDHLEINKVWEQIETKNNILVAVIDSGVDKDHPDLKGNMWINQSEIYGDNIDNDNNGYIDDIYGWDFLTRTNDPFPKFEEGCLERKNCDKASINHGTMVAGIIAAVSNNNIGISGIGVNTKIMSLRFSDQNGNGNTDDVIKAIEYAIDKKVDIINLSFGSHIYYAEFENVLQQAYKAGIVIVAAAGNEDANGDPINLNQYKMYPVCYEGANNEDIIIGVGASDKNDNLATFSSYGSSCMDVIAPGLDFFSTVVYQADSKNFNRYYEGGYEGTSFSAPIVSGLASLIKSYNPLLTNKEIMGVIYNNTSSVSNLGVDFKEKVGYGLVNPVKIFASLETSTPNNDLIMTNQGTVYFLGSDNKRYVFPDQKVFLSWYDDFDNIIKLTDEQLSKIKLAGVVTLKPGSLIKAVTNPKVYVVTRGGVIRAIASEEIAKSLFTDQWASMVIDVPDAFWSHYQISQTITNVRNFNMSLEVTFVNNINTDKNLFE